MQKLARPPLDYLAKHRTNRNAKRITVAVVLSAMWENGLHKEPERSLILPVKRRNPLYVANDDRGPPRDSRLT